MVELQETYLVIYVNAISAPSEEFAVIKQAWNQYPFITLPQSGTN
jgi:hypothetical protein